MRARFYTLFKSFTLRGKMNADKFRDYILGFIFYQIYERKNGAFVNEILKKTEFRLIISLVFIFLINLFASSFLNLTGFDISIDNFEEFYKYFLPTTLVFFVHLVSIYFTRIITNSKKTVNKLINIYHHFFYFSLYFHLLLDLV